MKSLKTKILVLVLSCVILTSLAIGFSSLYNANRVVQKDSIQIMNLLSESKAESFNEIFKRIKQSVETLAIYAKQDIEDIENFKNDASINQFTNNIVTTAVEAAKNTDGALSVYIRFDPSFASGTSGFFYVKDSNHEFTSFEPTDLNRYGNEDAERTSWFYLPKKKHEAIWLTPYYNKNIDEKMISYVVPLYLKDEFIGVVGMDIDFEKLTEIVADTRVYDTGYAFLTDNKANIVYHEEIKENQNLIVFNNGEFADLAKLLLHERGENEELISYTYKGVQKEASFRNLENGMRFIVTAPRSEIDEEANKMLKDIFMGVSFIITIAVILSILYTRRLVKPLQELTSVAQRVADGDMNVVINHHSKDEVGVLADSFRLTLLQLSQYLRSTHDLAYKDALTGVQNTRAYSEKMDRLNEKIKNGEAEFIFVIFDLNNLKKVNDNFGHMSGDLFIVSAARILCTVFDHYPVYRIGGDEFVVILEDISEEKGKQLLMKFENALVVQNNERSFQLIDDLWIAWGSAVYQKDVDKTSQDVFEKADQNMYKCKVKLKNEIKKS